MISQPSPIERPSSAGGIAPSPDRRTDSPPLAWLALLSGLAVLLNGWPVPLYYGVHLLLGSVPPILALLLWRTRWAVPMAVLASLRTVTLWGHPWAVVIFSLEMIWLTLAMRRCNGPPSHDGNGRVVLFSIAYWLLLGCPLVLLFYGAVMGIDPANLAVVTVKQAFNGVFNTVLAFGGLILIQALRSGHNHGPGVSLRGVIMALALLAITLPTLLISLAAGHQLEIAVQRGALDGLRTVNLALSRAATGAGETQQLMGQLGEAMAYRRIEANGRVMSSDPDLFRRLDSDFIDGGRSNVHDQDLAILIPRGPGPTLRKWVNGYWSYNRQYGSRATGGTYLVQVVEPARTVVMRLQQQSAALLAVTSAVVVLGTVLSLMVGQRFERECLQVIRPLGGSGGEPLQPLELSAVVELRQVAQLINHRIQQVSRLSNSLRQANDTLRRSRGELKSLLRCDPLTGCGNQEALNQRLQEEVDRCGRSGEPLSCLTIELGDLADIQRQYGRAAVDALLQGLAAAARKRLRRTDHLYRPERQRFVVLAIGCPLAQAQRLGVQLREAMAEVHLIPAPGAIPGGTDLTLRAGLRLGISSLNARHDSGEGLLERSLASLEPIEATGTVAPPST